nr:PREDICTED: uncharacterized protein LOC108203460 [Daucus carota subsp. sativus]
MEDTPGGTQRRHSARVILQKLRRNISDDVITIDVESNEKGGKESVIKRNTRSNKEVIIQQQKKDSTGVKNVAETTSDDDFQTPPRKSLKTVVQKRLPNKVDERPKKKQKENNDKGKNKGGQKQKIEQRDKIISKEDEIAKIRNSPRLLCDMISALSDEQEEWVKSAGFGSLVDFELWEIPQRLAYKVLEAFDEKKCMLVLQSGKIKIIDHLVHEILGLPCRGHEVKLAQGDSRYDRLLEWREQFSVSEGQSLIKASDVVEKMRQSGAVDDLFKINFLVVMANVLIRSNTNNFVAQSIISFDDDLDNCAKYNWASYLIRSLVITKQRWKRTSSLFYTGPMIFLLILYVDRVVFNINTKVPRKQPAFRGWTKEKLKEREVMELEPGAFGSGTILRDATPQQSNQTHKSAKERVEDDRQAEIEEIFAEQNNNGNDHPGVDNHPCGNDQPGGDDQPDDITEILLVLVFVNERVVVCVSQRIDSGLREISDC